MSSREVTSPRRDDGFISWGKVPVNASRLQQFVAVYKHERDALASRALQGGDTDYLKGQVGMLDIILNEFSFLADTDTDTGDSPDTDTATADEE